jgi:hypothetical protein
MPRHANLPHHLYVHVNNAALGPTMPAGTTKAIWHAVYGRPGQIVMAHVLLETGAHWCGLPLHQLGAHPDAFRQMPLGPGTAPCDLQPWGAMGDHLEAVSLDYLEGLTVMGSGVGPGFCGTHTGMVLDWSDGFSRYPQEHKPLNLIERSDGRYLLYPNNYCRFMDKHFTSLTRSDDLKHYRRGDRVFWEM